MSRTMQHPRVTVAMPLYRSAPFLDIIRANLDRLREPGLEVLISDRHGLDDAIDILECDYGHDPRVSFLRATDAIGWVGHFNELMGVARGDYFVWMQHDDTFPEGYVEALVAAAEATPGCRIAFGGIETQSLESRVTSAAVPLGRFCHAGQWSRRSAHRLLFSGWIGVPFRGAIHRARVLAAVGPMRDTPRSSGAEQIWIYALALGGPLVFTPATACVKRVHAGSFTGQLRVTPSVLWAGRRALAACIAPLPWTRQLEARALFGLFTLARIGYHAVLRVALPATMAGAIRDRLYRCVNLDAPAP